MSKTGVCPKGRVLSDDNKSVTGGSCILALPANAATLIDMPLWCRTSLSSEGLTLLSVCEMNW